MIKVLTEQDLQFAFSAEKDSSGRPAVLRIAYNQNSPYPPAEQDPSLVAPPTDSRILRDESGQIRHPRRDVHFEMAESVTRKPREKLDERLHRDGIGKTATFGIPYGTGPNSLERLVHVATGQQPAPGTGQKMIQTWEERYPVAAKFQRSMEDRIETPGWWRSPSGRIRHFYFDRIKDVFDRGDRRDIGSMFRIMSHITREARNFPCQELVAATTGHAVLDFIEQRRNLGLKARVGILLYDAVMVFAPLEELKVATGLLKDCLTVRRPWTINGRTFHFEADVSHCIRWGVRPTNEEHKLLRSYL
jgi:hypothetical protein